MTSRPIAAFLVVTLVGCTQEPAAPEETAAQSADAAATRAPAGVDDRAVGDHDRVGLDGTPQHDVRVGRDFPPLEDTHCRISLGTMEEMERAVEVFGQVLEA